MLLCCQHSVLESQCDLPRQGEAQAGTLPALTPRPSTQLWHSPSFLSRQTCVQGSLLTLLSRAWQIPLVPGLGRNSDTIARCILKAAGLTWSFPPLPSQCIVHRAQCTGWQGDHAHHLRQQPVHLMDRSGDSEMWSHCAWYFLLPCEIQEDGGWVFLFHMAVSAQVISMTCWKDPTDPVCLDPKNKGLAFSPCLHGVAWMSIFWLLPPAAVALDNTVVVSHTGHRPPFVQRPVL